MNQTGEAGPRCIETSKGRRSCQLACSDTKLTVKT